MEDTQSGGEVESTSAETPEDVSASPAEQTDQPEAEATEESTSQETKPEGEDEPEEWRNLVKKYNGDKAAAGKAFWETQNYASQVRRENEELKQRLAGLTQPPEPEAEELAPDLQVLDERLSALKEQIDGHPKRLTELGIKANQLQIEIARYETKAEMAGENEFERDKWEQKARLAKLHLEELGQKFSSAEKALPELKWEITKLNRERASIQRQIDSEKAREVQAQQKAQEFQESFPKQVDDYIKASADELGIPKDPKIRQVMWEQVNEALMVEFWRLESKGILAKDVDVPGLVKAKVERYKKSADEARRVVFGQTSQAKLKTQAALTGQKPQPAQKTPRAPQVPNETAEMAELLKREEDARASFMGRR